MVYYIYERTRVGSEYRFKYKKESHLLGRNVGLMGRFLQAHTPECKGELGAWNIDTRQAVRGLEGANMCFIIDLKPRDRKDFLLYELVKVWGYSEKQWTPLMLKIHPVLDQSRTGINGDDFKLSTEKYEALPDVYTFLYVRGTIQEGELLGPWTPPGPASTNGPVLHPAALDYFMREIGYCRKKSATA